MTLGIYLKGILFFFFIAVHFSVIRHTCTNLVCHLTWGVDAAEHFVLMLISVQQHLLIIRYSLPQQMN